MHPALNPAKISVELADGNNAEKMKNIKNFEYISIVLIATLKFSLDFLRYDHVNIAITKNQEFSIFLIFITILAFFVKKKKTKVKYNIKI